MALRVGSCDYNRAFLTGISNICAFLRSLRLNPVCTAWFFFFFKLVKSRFPCSHITPLHVLLFIEKYAPCAVFSCSWITVFLPAPARLTSVCLSLSLPPCFSAISKTKREQEKLVRSQSLCGSDSRRPVKENWEMQQHPQPQMEAAAHCVSQSFAGIKRLMWQMIRSCVIQIIFHDYEEDEAGPQDIIFPYLTPKQICLPIALKLPRYH